jgi:hypothetical protein
MESAVQSAANAVDLLLDRDDIRRNAGSGCGEGPYSGLRIR